MEAEPMVGAGLILMRLQEYGSTPFFITSRPATAREITLAWFRKWFPNVDESQIITQLEGNELGIAYYFEDSFEHAKEIVAGTGATVVLVQRPWNRNFPRDEAQRIIRHEYQKDESDLLDAYTALERYVLQIK